MATMISTELTEPPSIVPNSEQAKRFGDSPAKPEEADDRQIHYLYTQVNELLGRALLLEEQAKKQEQENPGEHDPDIDTAKIAALTMRSTAEQVSHELSNAATDKTTGKKRLPATRVATLTAAVEHIIHVHERDKNALADTPPEKKSKTTKTAVATIAIAAPAAIKSLRVVTMRPMHDASGGGAVSSVSGWLHDASSSIRSHMADAAEAARQTWNGISKGFSETVDEIAASEPAQIIRRYASDTAKAISDIVESPVQHLKKAGSAVASATQSYIVAPVGYIVAPVASAANTTIAGAKKLYESAIEKTTSGIEWVANAPSRARTWVAGIFGSKQEPTVAATQPPKAVQPPPNMARAVAQAMGLSLPSIGLLNQPIDSIMNISSQALPHLQTSVGAFVGFP